MKIHVIKTEEENKAALKRLETLLDLEEAGKLDPKGKEEADLLEVLIDAYEEKYHSIGPPDPIEYIKYIMENKNLKQIDIVEILGVSKSVFSKILSRKRPLSLEMIKKLHKTFNMPYDILMSDYELDMSA
ncbi:MAG: helix-turn-helix domain-containing protein [Bacteroidales bacterium]